MSFEVSYVVIICAPREVAQRCSGRRRGGRPVGAESVDGEGHDELRAVDERAAHGLQPRGGRHPQRRRQRGAERGRGDRRPRGGGQRGEVDAEGRGELDIGDGGGHGGGRHPRGGGGGGGHRGGGAARRHVRRAPACARVHPPAAGFGSLKDGCAPARPAGTAAARPPPPSPRGVSRNGGRRAAIGGRGGGGRGGWSSGVARVHNRRSLHAHPPARRRRRCCVLRQRRRRRAQERRLLHLRRVRASAWSGGPPARLAAGGLPLWVALPRGGLSGRGAAPVIRDHSSGVQPGHGAPPVGAEGQRRHACILFVQPRAPGGAQGGRKCAPRGWRLHRWWKR